MLVSLLLSLQFIYRVMGSSIINPSRLTVAYTRLACSGRYNAQEACIDGTAAPLLQLPPHRSHRGGEAAHWTCRGATFDRPFADLLRRSILDDLEIHPLELR